MTTRKRSARSARSKPGRAKTVRRLNMLGKPLDPETAAMREREMTSAGPDLCSYDYIVVSSSAGKDSQAMLHYVTWLCEQRGITARIIVVHSDLGRVEWQGTGELARQQAEHYGHRFEVVSRIGGESKGQTRCGVPLYEAGERYGDLIDQLYHRQAQLRAKAATIKSLLHVGDDAAVAAAYRRKTGATQISAKYIASVRKTGREGPAWPDKQNRWCTADFKRGPIGKLFTALADEWRKVTGKRRPCRILDCIGLRAEESAGNAKCVSMRGRAKRPQLEVRTSTNAQHVDSWLPIKWWSEARVWDVIEASGVPYHRAYDLGMPRLSCAFCVFGGRDALMIAGAHNPDLLDAYVQAERDTGYTFKRGLALADIQAALAEGQRVDRAANWDA